jgi:dUTPase
MKKLIWKKKYLDDKSGHWHEAKVKAIDWTYVVDADYDNDLYGCFLFVNASADEVLISKKKYKTIEQAQEYCQKHFETIAINLQKEINE